MYGLFGFCKRVLSGMGRESSDLAVPSWARKRVCGVNCAYGRCEVAVGPRRRFRFVFRLRVRRSAPIVVLGVAGCVVGWIARATRSCFR
jgi:hypothetical protein